MKSPFTISDLCWLAIIAAVSLCWWIDHRRWAKREELAKDTLYKMTAAPPGHWEPVWEGKSPRRVNDTPEEESKSLPEMKEEMENAAEQGQRSAFD